MVDTYYFNTVSSHCKQIPFRGGFLVVPHSIEFWQGQTDRLHDRIKFRKPKDDEIADGILTHEGENGWIFERLSP